MRYYERRGLLAEPVRSLGGHRLYPVEAVTTVRVIKAAQRLGFSLDDVAGLIDAGRHQHRPTAGLGVMAQAKLLEVESRMRDLQTIADSLRLAIDAGCDDLVACAGTPRCPIPFSSLSDHEDG